MDNFIDATYFMSFCPLNAYKKISQARKDVFKTAVTNAWIYHKNILLLLSIATRGSFYIAVANSICKKISYVWSPVMV